ncbi:MAG: hypothetical protein AMXMBFR64_34480 [Myxococcales bacterium]
MEPRDPKNRPYRVATYVVFMLFVLVFCVLTTISVVRGVFP